LPDNYESAIQDTEVSRQDIEKATAERNKNNITQQMYIDVASVNKSVTTYQAQGKAA
jgi:hypothetical protein